MNSQPEQEAYTPFKRGLVVRPYEGSSVYDNITKDVLDALQGIGVDITDKRDIIPSDKSDDSVLLSFADRYMDQTLVVPFNARNFEDGTSSDGPEIYLKLLRMYGDRFPYLPKAPVFMPLPLLFQGTALLKLERMVLEGRATREEIDHIMHFNPEELQLKSKEHAIDQMAEYLEECRTAARASLTTQMPPAIK